MTDSSWRDLSIGAKFEKIGETSRQLPNWPTKQSIGKANIDVHSEKFVLQRTSCVNVKVGTIEKVLRLYIPSHTSPSICPSIDFQAINLHHSLNIYDDKYSVCWAMQDRHPWVNLLYISQQYHRQKLAARLLAGSTVTDIALPEPLGYIKRPADLKP